MIFFKSQSFPQRLLPNHGNVSEETSMILPVAIMIWLQKPQLYTITYYTMTFS